MTSPETPAPSTPEPPASGLKRRWLLNAALAALIVGLAWVAIYQPGREKTASGPPLATLPADAVAHMRLEQPGHEPVVLEKTGGEWRLMAPVKARANRFNVDSLLRLLSAPGETRLPAVAAELSRFGLDRPQVRVRFENEEIALGALHPLKNQVYALYKNEIVLIPGHYLGTALYPYTRFIDSRLFEESRKLTALVLPGFTLTLKDGVWQRQPPDPKLSSDRINDFVSAWQNASALTVEKFSGRKTLGEVVVMSVKDNKSEKLPLDILAYKPDFVLHRRDENLEYHFTEESGERLLNVRREE